MLVITQLPYGTFVLGGVQFFFCVLLAGTMARGKLTAEEVSTQASYDEEDLTELQDHDLEYDSESGDGEEACILLHKLVKLVELKACRQYLHALKVGIWGCHRNQIQLHTSFLR